MQGRGDLLFTPAFNVPRPEEVSVCRVKLGEDAVDLLDRVPSSLDLPVKLGHLEEVGEVVVCSSPGGIV